MNEFLNDEANRCLQCKIARCQKGCPINTPIPEIIKLFKEDKISSLLKLKKKQDEAYNELLRQYNILHEYNKKTC